MGATIFMVLLAIAFFVALFFILLNIVFIIIWSVIKRHGKHPKKVFIILPVIFLVLSVIVEAVPVSVVVFIHNANNQSAEPVVWAQSGKMIYWGTDENGDETYDNFTLDGVQYILIADLPLSSDNWKIDKPAANIELTTGAADAFMKAIFGGGDDVSTLYPVENDGGFKLYTTGDDVYGPASQQEAIIAYYQNHKY